MPTQLYTNENISFICGRNFVWNGVDYSMGDEWDQSIAPGSLDKLVRSRYVYPVVESTATKPRHWHHHVHVREDLERRLGITRELGQSSIATREPQIVIDEVPLDTTDYNLEFEDQGEALKNKAIAAALTEGVLREENDENPEPVEETEPEELITDTEVEETEDERVIEEDDLYDPTEHGVDEVMDYLAGDIDEKEYERVVAVERANKARKGILNNV